MKKIGLFILLIASIKIGGQIIIYEDCDIKISLLKNEISLREIKNQNDIYYLIYNKSKSNIIFRKDGFEGESFIYKDDVRMETVIRKHYDGYLGNLEIEECEKSFIKLKKKEIIRMPLRLIALKNVNAYVLDFANNYEIEINSFNNKETASYNGCDRYIDTVKNAKIVNINIHKKIKLVP